MSAVARVCLAGAVASIVSVTALAQESKSAVLAATGPKSPLRHRSKSAISTPSPTVSGMVMPTRGIAS